MEDNPVFKLLMETLEWNIRSFDSFKMSPNVGGVERLLADVGVKYNGTLLLQLTNLTNQKEKTKIN